MKSRHTALPALLLTVALASCAPSPAADPPGQKADHGIMHDIHASPTQRQIDEWSPQIAAEAKDVATQAATAYARPNVPESQWFAGLAPYLSENAQTTFAQSSNLNLTATTVKSVQEPTPGASPAIATVTVHTNAGTLTLLLSRAEGQWVVETITSGQ